MRSFVLLLTAEICFVYASNIYLLGDFTANDLESNGILEHFRQLFETSIKYTDFNISDKEEMLCKKILEENYAERTLLANVSLRKFISSSSNSKNDVGTYSKCKNREDFEILNNNTYISNYSYFVISKNVFSEYNSVNNDDFLFGLCLNSHCGTKPITKFVIEMNLLLDKIFNVTNEKELIVRDMKKVFKKEFNTKYIGELIPLVFIFIQVVFVLLPSIPAKVFKCCFRHTVDFKEKNAPFKNDSSEKGKTINSLEVGDLGDITGINKKYLYQFKTSFYLGDNGEELFNLKNESTEINNESGLSYIKGIRGITMIMFLFGTMFLILYENPILKRGAIGKLSFIKNSKTLPFFIFCIRNCPKVLYSCSGFCLCYKLLCYLDDKLAYEYENEGNEMNNINKVSINDLNSETDKSNSMLDGSLDMSTLLSEKNPSLLSNKYCYRFLFYQLHKFIIMVIFVFFLRCCFKLIFHYIMFFGPLFEVLLQNIIDTISFRDIIGHFLFYQNFFDLFFPSKTGRDCILTIFSMVINEYNFFVISTLIIFFGYKQKISLDYLMIIIIIILLIAKCLIVLITDELNPLTFYFSSKFQALFINPVFNYPYYAIGIFFGFVNFSVQKGISYKEAIRQDKPYLVLPIRIISLFSTSGTFFSNFIYFLIALVTSFFGLLLSVLFAMTITSNEDSTPLIYFLKIFALFDIEIFVILLHIFILACYLKGENTIYKFLSNKNWTIANRLYFSFILCCTPCIYFMLYQSETRISLSFFSIFFYGLICGFMSFLLSSAVCIVFELPYKKIIKLINLMRMQSEKRKNSGLSEQGEAIALENKEE